MQDKVLNKRQMGLDFLPDYTDKSSKNIPMYDKCIKWPTRVPWALTLCLRSNLAIDQSSRQIWADFQNCYICSVTVHETWPLAKVPEVACIISFYPKGAKLGLFSLYGQRLLRYEQIFALVLAVSEIQGHENWKCNEWSQTELEHLTVKSTLHTLNTYP